MGREGEREREGGWNGRKGERVSEQRGGGEGGEEAERGEKGSGTDRVGVRTGTVFT